MTCEHCGWRPPARVIETAEELAAAPILTLVREQLGVAPSGLDYGGVWERRTSGWECVAGGIGWLSPKLPATVLWQPEGGEVNGR